MKKKLTAILHLAKQYTNVFLMAISPMALLMLIVAFIMFLDYYGEHQRLQETLDEAVLTTTATITSCYNDNRRCYAEFTDIQGNERYGTLNWKYYPRTVADKLANFERGATVQIRYARQRYQNDIVLAEYYHIFLSYKGYLYEIGGIALVSWIILILHPEIMLYTLIDNLDAYMKEKWDRITKSL